MQTAYVDIMLPCCADGSRRIHPRLGPSHQYRPRNTVESEVPGPVGTVWDTIEQGWDQFDSQKNGRPPRPPGSSLWAFVPAPGQASILPAEAASGPTRIAGRLLASTGPAEPLIDSPAASCYNIGWRPSCATMQPRAPRNRSPPSLTWEGIAMSQPIPPTSDPSSPRYSPPCPY